MWKETLWRRSKCLCRRLGFLGNWFFRISIWIRRGGKTWQWYEVEDENPRDKGYWVYCRSLWYIVQVSFLLVYISCLLLLLVSLFYSLTFFLALLLLFSFCMFIQVRNHFNFCFVLLYIIYFLLLLSVLYTHFCFWLHCSCFNSYTEGILGCIWSRQLILLSTSKTILANI